MQRVIKLAESFKFVDGSINNRFYCRAKVSNDNNSIAKTITDYLEQTKQTNYTTLKDVFLTKDDKVDLVKLIVNIKDENFSNLLKFTGLIVTVIAICTGLIIHYK